ncbi:RNA polymerase sigma factor [Streptomyces sp. NPDC088812]|uniref:RNA polymerase sigma factor n=1 Tax=Streptomyces sp. NPDC088812 TaxID=3365905 RepID=UPI00380862FA
MTLSPRTRTGAHGAAPPRTEAGSDAAAVARSWEHADAFGEPFDRYAQDVHRYLARRLGSDAADDLTAETFVVAFQRRRRDDLTRDNARPWLYGIATRLVARHRRAEARRLRAWSRAASLAEGRPADADDVGEDHAARYLDAELAGALAWLPGRYRDVLLLTALGSMDYAQTAEALGIPVGTVRSRLHRARSGLRDALRGTGLDPARPGFALPDPDPAPAPGRSHPEPRL